MIVDVALELAGMALVLFGHSLSDLRSLGGEGGIRGSYCSSVVDPSLPWPLSSGQVVPIASFVCTVSIGAELA